MKTIKLVIGKLKFTFFVCLLRTFISIAFNLNFPLNLKAIIIFPASLKLYVQNVKFSFRMFMFPWQGQPPKAFFTPAAANRDLKPFCVKEFDLRFPF